MNTKNRYLNNIVIFRKNIPITKENIFEEDNYDVYTNKKITKNSIEKDSNHKKLVRSSLFLEQQKIQTIERYRDKSFLLTDSKYAHLRREIKLNNINTIGLDLSETENRALHAIISLFSECDYYCNFPDNNLCYERVPQLKFKEKVPIMNIKISDYLEAFGVTKFISGRGKSEFSAAQRKIALSSLLSLANKKFLICYNRSSWNNKSKYPEVQEIRAVTNLFEIIDGKDLIENKLNLNKTQNYLLPNVVTDSVPKKALRNITIKLSSVFVDQIENYFVIKPHNYIDEIRSLSDKKISKYVYRFIDFLFTEVSSNLSRYNSNWNYIIERNYETLAINLRMDALIENRQWKRIRDELNKCYETAVFLGYMKDYYTDLDGTTKKMDKLILNQQKFYFSHPHNNASKNKYHSSNNFRNNTNKKRLSKVAYSY